MNNVLIIGPEARAHVLAELAASYMPTHKVFWHQANGGLDGAPSKVVPSGLSPRATIGDLVDFARANDIELTIPSGETLLDLGIVDSFQDAGLAIFGPTGDAFQNTEGSKVVSKLLAEGFGVPTPSARIFRKSERAEALAFLQSNGLAYPVMVKASGLCAGKGAVECQDEVQAASIVNRFFDGQFGEASESLLIETFLRGLEFSVFALVDKHGNIIVLPPAMDFKNVSATNSTKTGGMGAIARPPYVTDEILKMVKEQIIAPYVAGLLERGVAYTGVLYAGCMLTPDGNVFLLEWNARYGDPELQPLALLHKRGLIEAMLRIARGGTIEDMKVAWSDKSALCVVVARDGYPDKKGYEPLEIPSWLLQRKDPRLKIFHAGTGFDSESGKFISIGGRVLSLVATGNTIYEARRVVHEHIGSPSLLRSSGYFCRNDIGAGF